MIRVTNNYLSNNFVRNLNGHNESMDRLQHSISTQDRIQFPHQDPTGTSIGMMYRSKIVEFDRYRNNVEDGQNKLEYVHQRMMEVNDYLQAIREEAVKGANGIYTKEDREKMGVQVEQYLRQIIEVGNNQVGGRTVFSGYQTNVIPFDVTYNKVEGWGEPLVDKVTYKGDIGLNYREVDRGEYVPVNMPGNRAFWASHQRITSQTVGTGYVADRDQVVRIDGTELKIKEGDNLQSIVNTINNAHLSVKAEIDNTSGADFLILQTTQPHQMVLEDLEGGSVFQDLGIIARGAGIGPNNYAPSAIVYGDSMFDKVINLRNALFANDIEGVNAAIGGLDEGHNNLLTNIASIDANAKRLDIAQQRTMLNRDLANELYSNIQAADLAKAISDLKNVEVEHLAALKVGATILPRTLLDFIH